MIGIVNYGLGNVRAFENIYRRLGLPAGSVSTAEELKRVTHILLPGVGSFDWAMSRLVASGMIEVLVQRVQEDRVPVLGVCVGMQMMANASEEGSRAGLGWIPGRVERFQSGWFTERTHLPHMGWNDVDVVGHPRIFSGMEAPRFYFLHSYFFRPEQETHIAAHTEYGTRFASAVRRGNIWGTQFHPEKSHHWGVQLLRNFAES